MIFHWNFNITEQRWRHQYRDGNEQRSDYVIPSEKSSLNFVDKLLDHDEVYLHVKFKHGLLYLHGLTLGISKKKIVGQMFKISFASKESK